MAEFDQTAAMSCHECLRSQISFFRFPSRQPGFEFCDLRLKLLNDGSNLLLWESLMDVLRAVDVPRLDLEQNGPFDFDWVG